MIKIWKNTFICMAVLSSVSLVAVILVLGLNALLPAKTSFFDKKKLDKVCPATEYRQLTDADLVAMNINLGSFNAAYTNSKVRAIFLAKGGVNDGRYILESEGDGFNDKYPVILYISYNADGAIMAVTDLQVDKGNTFWADLKPYLDDIYSGLIGKSNDVGGGSDLLNTSTGATQSMNGIARAVNIANKFIVEILGKKTNNLFTVTDSALLFQLREITSQNAVFTGYPYNITEAINGVSTEVAAVYVSSNRDIVFETKSDAGRYGKTSLLVLVNIENKTVKKICPRSLSAVDKSGINSEFLDNSATLTAMFEGYNIGGIDGMEKYLTGSTGATQTANGIKTAVIAALKNIDGFLSKWGENLGGNT